MSDLIKDLIELLEKLWLLLQAAWTGAEELLKEIWEILKKLFSFFK